MLCTVVARNHALTYNNELCMLAIFKLFFECSPPPCHYTGCRKYTSNISVLKFRCTCMCNTQRLYMYQILHHMGGFSEGLGGVNSLNLSPPESVLECCLLPLPTWQTLLCNFIPLLKHQWHIAWLAPRLKFLRPSC